MAGPISDEDLRKEFSVFEDTNKIISKPIFSTSNPPIVGNKNGRQYN